MDSIINHQKKLHNPPDVIKIFLGFQPHGPCVPWDLLHICNETLHWQWINFLSIFVLKVPILKEVNFGKMKLCRVEHFWTYLSSPMGVIAIVFSNHAHWWGQICPKVFNSTEFHFSEVYFFQNWYFSIIVIIVENFYKISLTLWKIYACQEDRFNQLCCQFPDTSVK